MNAALLCGLYLITTHRKQIISSRSSVSRSFSLYTEYDTKSLRLFEGRQGALIELFTMTDRFEFKPSFLSLISSTQRGPQQI